ncbi:VTT domain-containing protein [Rugosimonospora africana]|uniref:Membrane protein n=1 Tax=Rugosimonospora africana TaxID=556532 RepID=A0A8J3VM88_9ACTN|nr:VTT domain-containing protein [Rugosimonospora africana]GIH12069.1 membrane protein [Rugosimonospora africana]
MSGLLEAVIALGYGFASAVVPLVNAEAFAVVAGTHGSHVAVAVLGLALGQTAGKLLLFESARRATGRLARRIARGPRSARAAARASRWAGSIRRWLSRRRTGLPTVFVSAATGIPPLAAVSLAAGTADLRRCEFAAACLLGRVIRFAILALPLALA